MALSILSASDYGIRLKATIQATGRLGFTDSTASNLNLSKKKWAKFAKDSETESLFIGFSEEGNDDAFEIKMTSGYYYIPAKALFDALGYDYARHNIMFDLVRYSENDAALAGEAYKMCPRITKRKEKDMEM